MKSRLQPWHLLLLILAAGSIAGNRTPSSTSSLRTGYSGRSSERNEYSSTTAGDAGLPSKARSSGLDNRPIDPGEEVGRIDGEVECRQRLGGILRYYHRKPA